MRIFFDTEFIDDGRTIDLISIGLVREDQSTMYVESTEVDLSRASPWVREHVLPKLTGANRKNRADIAKDIAWFVGDKPEFWAHYAAYDWVALCQLYGPLVSIPFSWPRFCNDLQQELHRRNVVLPLSGGHNALNDAMTVFQGWQYLRGAVAYRDDWAKFTDERNR